MSIAASDDCYRRRPVSASVCYLFTYNILRKWHDQYIDWAKYVAERGAANAPRPMNMNFYISLLAYHIENNITAVYGVDKTHFVLSVLLKSRDESIRRYILER